MIGNSVSPVTELKRFNAVPILQVFFPETFFHVQLKPLGLGYDSRVLKQTPALSIHYIL